jgi:hypothetical protein
VTDREFDRALKDAIADVLTTSTSGWMAPFGTR